MRKSLILVALVSVLFLSASLIIQILSVSAEFSRWVWSGVLVGGTLLIGSALILFVLYYFRQGRAINQQFKQQEWNPIIQRELFRGKIAEAKRPYRRESRLFLIVLASMALTVLSLPLANFIVSYAVNFYDQQQHIQKIADIACLLCIPISILVYALLSKDFTRRSEDTRNRV
ncbi:MAG: hypothetical protein WCD86_18115 [Ktedonobacteraceae bacterium]